MAAVVLIMGTSACTYDTSLIGRATCALDEIFGTGRNAGCEEAPTAPPPSSEVTVQPLGPLY